MIKVSEITELGKPVFLRHVPFYKTIKILVVKPDDEGVRSLVFLGTKTRYSLHFRIINSEDSLTKLGL